MKIFVIIACVLVLVHAGDVADTTDADNANDTCIVAIPTKDPGIEFNKFYAECENEKPEDPTQSHQFNVLLCASKKAGIISTQNKIHILKAVALCVYGCSEVSKKLECILNTATCCLRAITAEMILPITEELPLNVTEVIYCAIGLQTVKLLDNKK